MWQPLSCWDNHGLFASQGKCLFFQCGGQLQGCVGMGKLWELTMRETCWSFLWNDPCHADFSFGIMHIISRVMFGIFNTFWFFFFSVEQAITYSFNQKSWPQSWCHFIHYVCKEKCWYSTSTSLWRDSWWEHQWCYTSNNIWCWLIWCWSGRSLDDYKDFNLRKEKHHIFAFNIWYLFFIFS